MEAINYAPNAMANMVLPPDAQVVTGVLGNAVYLPAGHGSVAITGSYDVMSLSLWRTWDGVTETDSKRGIFAFKNCVAFFEHTTGKLHVTLPDGTSTETELTDDTELTHWVFMFIKNGSLKIYKNAVLVYEAQTGNTTIDLSDGFVLGGGKTHATFDEVCIYEELLKQEQISGLYYLISSGTPPAQIENIAQETAAKYLGVCETVPANSVVVIVKGEHPGAVYANLGDWVLMSKTVGGWKAGVCYRWTGMMWLNLEPEYNYEAQYQACLSHICEIPVLKQDTGHYGALFAKLLVAQEAFVEKLITSEAFINRLATNEAFIDKLVTKKLLVDSDTANPDNFELAINEQVGILAKKGSEKIFEITPDGQSFFSGSIEAGPLLLSLKSPGEKKFDFPAGTRIYTICKEIAAGIKGIGLFRCTGAYGNKHLKSVSISHQRKENSFDDFGGEYYTGNVGIWMAVYRKRFRADFVYEEGIIEFIYEDGMKETIKEGKTVVTYTRIGQWLIRKNSWDIYPDEAAVKDPVNSSSGETKTENAIKISINADSYTLLWRNLPLGTDPSYISGTVYRDNDGRLFVVP